MKSKNIFLELLVHLSRLFVGGMFVFSGFVKLVDPIGSQYKFEEYFSEAVLNITFLEPWALQFSILLIIAEIMLGVMLLLGFKSKITVWSLFGLTLIFLFLTLYSAVTGQVTDCGCFGDAIKLTPWETFWKNVILIALIALLLIRVKDIKEILPKKITIAITLISLLSFSYITYYVLNHLPIIDFRAYAVGKSIPEGMEVSQEELEKDEFAMPKVKDFAFEDTQNDVTEEILTEEKVMLIIVAKVKKKKVKKDKDKKTGEEEYEWKVIEDGFAEVKKVADAAISKGYKVYGATGDFPDELILLQNKYDLPFEFLFCDPTTLKTIIRANPGIVTLSKGTVTGKWNWTDADEVKF